LVFSSEPPPDVLDRIEKLDVLDTTVHQEVGLGRKSAEGNRTSFVRRRKPSNGSERDSVF